MFLQNRSYQHSILVSFLINNFRYEKILVDIIIKTVYNLLKTNKEFIIIRWK